LIGVTQGKNESEETISQHLFWPKMRDQITTYVQTCPNCQRNNHKVKKHGWLPPKEAEASPWDKMSIDLIGPYTIRRKGKNDPKGKPIMIRNSQANTIVERVHQVIGNIIHT
jgi:Integrase zinc binding domain